ncbi:MAG: lipopolysaccharide biosynthesis protein [Anaerolineales bacterium]|nr:lipopolysaccharide biosynthesis protein [Anaerolineales bacterium]
MIPNSDNQDIGLLLPQKVTRGILWNTLAFGFGKFAVLLTTSVLARLLTKEEFGQVAIAFVVISYLSVIKDLGLGVALIQSRGDVKEAANTVFTINIILGFLISAIVIPLAPPIANYFHDPSVVPVLRWLGLSFAINAFGSVHMIWLLRELDYRRKFIPDMGNTVVKGITSIAMAFAGFGVWSLVVGQIAGALASVIMVWIILPWRPQLTINRKITGSLMKFGGSIIGGDILGTIIDNIDYVIVGRVFGVAQLSVYTLAYRLPEMLLIGNLWVLGQIAFPAFSSIQDKPEEMRNGFLGSVRLVELLATPISLGLFIAADPIVRVVFGDQWLEAIPMLRVLALFAWVYSLGFHIGGIYKAVGRPDILLNLSIFSVIILIPSLLIGSSFGVIGVAWGHLFAVLVRRIVSLSFATRFLKVTLGEILSELKPSLRAGLVMAFTTVAVLYLTASLSPLVQLIFVMLAGVSSYIGVAWWIEKDNLFHLIRAIGVSKKA